LVKTKKEYNFNLEALRGVAALLVVWGHATSPNSGLDPLYTPGNNWFFTGPGHVAVLVFFVLSGYVVAGSEPEPLNRTSIPTYVKKRFIRIYPIYLVCLLLALLVAGTTYSPAIILGHLTLTQGVLSPTINSISPSWSLVYEILFYAAFVPLSAFRLDALPLAILCVAMGCASTFSYSLGYGDGLIPSLLFGGAFWLGGVVLARVLATEKKVTPSYAQMLAWLLLFVSLDKLDAPFTLFHRVEQLLFGKSLSELPKLAGGVVEFRDLAWFPYCVGIVSLFSGKAFPYRKLILVTLLLIPATTFFYYYQHFTSHTLSSILVATNCYFGALVLFFFPAQTERVATRVMKSLEPTGALSYAIYLLHFPVLWFLSHTYYFSGTPVTYTVRLAMFLLLSLAGAWWLEMKFQPRIRAIFWSKN
jgi:peptidoglycan/LPS O-acetylase OafA/YrhL